MGKDYHYDACSITGDECDGIVCSSCDWAKEHEKGESAEKQEALITFDSKVNLKGIKLKSNREHTVILLEKEEQLNEIIGKKPEIFSQTTREPNDKLIEEHFPEYHILNEALHLGNPKEILADADKLGIFKYETAIYIIAPFHT